MNRGEGDILNYTTHSISEAHSTECESVRKIEHDTPRSPVAGIKYNANQRAQCVSYTRTAY